MEVSETPGYGFRRGTLAGSGWSVYRYNH